ncbi:hypothetical protein C0J52_20632, partial [Blattella germanica]
SALRYVLEDLSWCHLAKQIQKALEEAEVVPDGLVVQALEAAAIDSRCNTQGFIFDGFPNTVSQCEELARKNLTPFLIIYLQSKRSTCLEHWENTHDEDFSLREEEIVALLENDDILSDFSFGESDSENIEDSASDSSGSNSDITDIEDDCLSTWDEDFACRRAMCYDLLESVENDNLMDILFSDEATFHGCGKMDRHNSRIWVYEEPHKVSEWERDTPKVNVWLGMTNAKLYGPFFFAERSITGNIYLNMLELVLEPLDFFAWGYITFKVYTSKVNDLPELRNRIWEATGQITVEMLQSTFCYTTERRCMCFDLDRGHVERH